VYPELWEDFQQRTPLEPGRRWSWDAPQLRVEQIGASLGIPVVDLLGPLRERAKSDPYLYYPWNQHWTAQGHATVARALLGELSPAEGSSP
jgi:hypothetical protein